MKNYPVNFNIYMYIIPKGGSLTCIKYFGTILLLQRKNLKNIFVEKSRTLLRYSDSHYSDIPFI